MSEREPDTSEVIQQEDIALQTVPVKVEGPVRTQALPAPIGSMRSYTVTESASPILNRDARRRRAVIVTIDQPIYVGLSQNEADSGMGFLLPVSVPLEITHADEVWAAVSLAVGESIVSVLNELWTE